MTVSVIEYLEQTAALLPDKTAYSDSESSLTFAELRRVSRQVATALLATDRSSAPLNVREPVVVFMDKSVACIAAFLGIASAGKFYVPIDVEMPAPRIASILEALQPRLAVAKRDAAGQLAEAGFDGTTVLYEDCLALEPDDKVVDDAIARIVDADLLYVLFTSGSTGVPKGVTIRHVSVVDYIERIVEVFAFSSRDTIANQAPFYFDNSVLDIYTALRTGATMHIVPPKLFAYPVRLLEELNACQATSIFWVPSAMILVANLRALGSVSVPTLDKILFAGEVMPNKQLNLWRKHYPDALFANLYGPTEITVDCTYYIVDRPFDDAEPLPMGIPFRNSDVLVLGEDDTLIEPTCADVAGELCVRGTSLSCGYYNNPAKTAEAFVQNPLNTAYPEVIYRTGDLVRYNERGELVYLSRKDFQIKRFGHRIELGEIETACSAHPQVDHCCCVYREQASELVLAVAGNADPVELEDFLASRLPSYMVPSRMQMLDALPTTANGKIDRLAVAEAVFGGEE